MKLEVGMYVRYTRGMFNGHVPPRIAKIVDCSDSVIIKLDNNQIIINNDVKKASHNIIDLIEVGDYVNGYEVVDFDNTYFNGNDRLEEPKRLSVMVDRDKCMGFAQTYFKNEEIHSVLTKEQFESQKYIVESE